MKQLTEKFTNNQLLIGTLIIIISILGMYIFETRDLDMEQVANEYYNLGIQIGILYWDSLVVGNVTSENPQLPYIIDNEIYFKPMGVQNDN